MTTAANFIGNFSGGGYRPNRYRVTIDGQGISSNIHFVCKAASIPSSNRGNIDVPYMGRQIKVPGDTVFDDWTVTILLDMDLGRRKEFEEWHRKILDNFTNAATYSVLRDHYSSATVDLLDRQNSPIYQYRVLDMFPTQISEVTLGYDQNDQVAEQQITFAINGWTSA